MGRGVGRARPGSDPWVGWGCGADVLSWQECRRPLGLLRGYDNSGARPPFPQEAVSPIPIATTYTYHFTSPGIS